MCKTARRIWLRILSIACEKEVKVLDCAEWWHYYYLISFNCFPLFSAILTSLIKLILWPKFSTGKRQAEAMVHGGGKDHRVLLHFIKGEGFLFKDESQAHAEHPWLWRADKLLFMRSYVLTPHLPRKGDIKSKLQRGTNSHQSERSLLESLQIASSGKAVEKREPSYTIVGMYLA